MKLAEALLLRSDLQKKVASLRERVVANAVVQEGDEPHEAPDQLMKEAFGVLAELETLVSNVNKTNLATQLPDGRTLTRDRLRQRPAVGELRREIKWVAILEVSKLQKQADDLAKKLRELNGLIQQANWEAD